VHQRLLTGQHPRSHLNALCAQHDRGRRRPCVAHSARGDEGQVDTFRNERQQDHRRRAERRLESAALDALDHQCVDSGVGGLHRRPQRTDDVHDGHARVMQPPGEQSRISCRCEDMAHPGPGKHVDDRRVLLPTLDHQVRGDGPIGELPDTLQVRLPLGGQRFDHSEAACVGHRRRELRSGNVGHRRLNDREFDAEQGLDAVGHDSFLSVAAAR
jgi:hypothetical protein